ASLMEASSLSFPSFLLAFSFIVPLFPLVTVLCTHSSRSRSSTHPYWLSNQLLLDVVHYLYFLCDGRKDCVIFNPLQKYVNMPSWKFLSSFELIVRGTPNLHNICSHVNFSTCLSFVIVKGFASTYFVECSTVMARNFKLLVAAGRGHMMLTPQWLNVHVFPNAIASFPDTFVSIDCSWRCVASLMLSAKAARYITNTSPLIREMSVDNISMNFSSFGFEVNDCLDFEGLTLIPCLVVRCPKNGPSSMPKLYFFGFRPQDFIQSNRWISCPPVSDRPQDFIQSNRWISCPPVSDRFPSYYNGSRDPRHVSMSPCKTSALGLKRSCSLYLKFADSYFPDNRLF
nr:hypothetical protein [Tanacetum cinerariifolium]